MKMVLGGAPAGGWLMGPQEQGKKKGLVAAVAIVSGSDVAAWPRGGGDVCGRGRDGGVFLCLPFSFFFPSRAQKAPRQRDKKQERKDFFFIPYRWSHIKLAPPKKIRKKDFFPQYKIHLYNIHCGSHYPHFFVVGFLAMLMINPNFLTHPKSKRLIKKHHDRG